MSRRPEAGYVRAAKRFRQKRYLFVKGLLPRPLLEYLKVYYAILMADNRFSPDSQCPSSLSLGGDPALDAVLEWIRPELGRLVGFTLAPTYSYTRRYAKGELLARHVDRAACEISVTASIQIPKGAGPSVMYLKPPHAKETKVEMREGDGCVYAGTEVEHWRERFCVDGYIQLFLHFVARRGPHYPNLLFDGRERLGARAQKQSKKKRDKRGRTHHTFSVWETFQHAEARQVLAGKKEKATAHHRGLRTPENEKVRIPVSRPGDDRSGPAGFR